ncbi:MAG TPA: DUF4382 domain-containing protein [Albitalea sp.]|nr:DUF4382 domain-containing protein [Albitalea sp.]
MNLWTRLATTASIAAAALLSACGGGGGSPGTTATANGMLRVALTDAPACGYDHVNVTVQKVRVHQSSNASDTDSGWSEVVLNPAQKIDLLGLTNGVLQELGQTSLPAGTYTQMRLVLAANDATTPMANSVTPTGGAETAMDTPSGMQTGLKMNVDITVAANQVADFVLDFDACKSVVKRGSSGMYNLKPVVKVIPRLSDAGLRVVGYVAPALAVPTTSVSVQLNGVPVKATPPDSTGKFVLYPVPVGTYDLVVSAAGRATATITGVPVVDTGYTYVNTTTSVIDPPASTMYTASGTVTTGSTPIDATVDVVKKYTGGPNVVVAGAPVDGTTGVFSYALPASAPVRTSYAAAASAVSFTADPATPTGKYTLSATSGTSNKTIDIDVSGADSTGNAFTFP